MANPAIFTCSPSNWTIVASGITSGALYRMDPTISFAQTYRMAGTTAPTSYSESFPIFTKSEEELIAHTDPIDVYLISYGSSGRVRVDV